ncbi:olfactory receptor 5V1-like [Varanus komodoensis]|uniref:olfactory receptor 5V1-like n=1 Tax=Varanus komodoensis TaxID=61221 RepID=UPI001CF778A3|nr:olfactory receptor 5V1-like [Varanus komodoensis]
MENLTVVTEFTLEGLSNNPQLHNLLFVVFLIIYFITLVANMTIILVTGADPHLHTPMYFFLSHLSFVDICYSSVTVPKMLENLVAKKTISASGCIAQMFFIIMLACTEILILSVMAYDRYAAICLPLHYLETMNKKMCNQMIVGAWVVSFLHALINTLPVSALHFCGPNRVSNFSCELPPLLLLSCSDILVNEIVLLASLVMFVMSASILTLVSYVHILFTILKIPSTEDRSKAFSTCSSHLIVVSLFYVTGFFRYMKPASGYSLERDQLVGVLYSILTPTFNPLIYRLWNKEVKLAVRRIMGNRMHLR